MFTLDQAFEEQEGAQHRNTDNMTKGFINPMAKHGISSQIKVCQYEYTSNKELQF